MSVSTESPAASSTGARPNDPEHLLDGHLLLATDGSVSADGAVALLAALRRQAARCVEVLAVFEPAPMPVPSVDPSLAAMTTMASDEVLRAEFFSRVDHQLDRAFAGLPPVAVQQAEGSPVRLIVDAAHRSQAALIVTGLRVHSLLDRLVGDETALRVTRATDRPVFAVAPTLAPPLRRAVVGIDFSRASLRAAHAAAGMLVDGGTLTLLHARPVLDAAPAAESSLDEPYARGVSASLDGLRRAILALHPHITVAVERRDGEPADAVLDFAVGTNADFVAVGRHRRNAISHAILGSVATTLLRKAQLSVLVLPPMEKDAGS